MAVTLLRDIDIEALRHLLDRYGLKLQIHEGSGAIPGSFWGDSEAGLILHDVYAREDTPVHSILHEACHYVCMDSARREALHTNAGGDTNEENGVCYLQIILADYLPVGRHRMMADMDEWGYSFRLGSAGAWFDHDAEDAKTWLIENQLITKSREPTWKLRN